MAAGPWIGKWEFVSTENFDEYLKAVGVGMIKRKLAGSAKPTIIYSEAGGKLTMRTESTLKTTEISFTPGVEFDEETADDRKAKSVVTAEGNKLVHKQKIDNVEALTVREFNGNEMTSTSSCGNVTAVRKYKKAT